MSRALQPGPRLPHLQITGIFTIASIARSYCVRRWFNASIHAAAQRIAAEAGQFN